MTERPTQPLSELNSTAPPRHRRSWFHRAWIPIRAKIALSYLGLATILAIGVVYLVTRIAFDTIEERFTNQLIESSKLVAAKMVRVESGMLESLRLIAHTSELPKAIVQRDAERLRELSFPIAVNHQDEAVEILDADGNLLFSMRHQSGGKVEDYYYGKDGGAIFMEQAFVQKVVHGEADEAGDKYSGVVSTELGLFYYIGGPVKDDQGVQVGAVLVGISLKNLAHQMRQETLAQISIYDLAGRVFISTFPEAQPLDLESAGYLLSNQDQTSLRRRVVSVSNIDYDELVGPWEGRARDDLGLVGASLAQSFLVQASRLTRLQIFAMVAAAFILVSILGIYLANFITRPLVDLMSATDQVSQGDLMVQVDSRSNDEVGVLAHAFNKMVTGLRGSRSDLLSAYEYTLEGWARALEMRDQETEGHTKRVAEITVLLAREMGFNENELVDIHRGALLHDIGKMAVPDAILLKPGSLTQDEWEIMRKHPVYAYRMLHQIEFLRPALVIPKNHHERWDGTGYPDGLKGEAIPAAARMFAVVDVWDALNSSRPYRPPLKPEAVVSIIRQESGSHFDPQVVEIFLGMIERLTVNGYSKTESPDAS